MEQPQFTTKFQSDADVNALAYWNTLDRQLVRDNSSGRGTGNPEGAYLSRNSGPDSRDASRSGSTHPGALVGKPPAVIPGSSASSSHGALRSGMPSNPVMGRSSTATTGRMSADASQAAMQAYVTQLVRGTIRELLLRDGLRATGPGGRRG